MAFYVGHDSALAYWLTKRGDEWLPEPADDRSLALADVSWPTLADARLPFDVSESRPLHVLVGDQKDKRRLTGTVVHVWQSPIPKGSFCILDGENRIASPEFTYLLMASRRPFVEVVERGCYLCSRFAVDEGGAGYSGPREPLTTPERIRSFIERVPSAYGAKQALKALEYVVPNTASPMEVILAMEYSLPYTYGGFAMPRVDANQEILVADELQPLAGTERFYGDLYMSKIRCDTEYDSYEYHTGRFRLDHTQMRRNILETMGIKTISATYDQMNTFERFENFIWMIEERFGIGHSCCTSAQKRAQIDLYDFLMDLRRPKF